MLAVAAAKYLHALEAGFVFSDDPDEANVFIDTMPSGPDVCVGIFTVPGPSTYTKAPTDLPSLQLRARGGPDGNPRPPYVVARALIDAFACLDNVWLDPDGDDRVKVIGCDVAQGDPVPLGKDANGRHEFVVNLDLRTLSPTTHRPLITT